MKISIFAPIVVNFLTTPRGYIQCLAEDYFSPFVHGAQSSYRVERVYAKEIIAREMGNEHVVYVRPIDHIARTHYSLLY